MPKEEFVEKPPFPRFFSKYPQCSLSVFFVFCPHVPSPEHPKNSKQDPTLNSLFDRAFAEFAEAKSTQQDEAAADALDSSRMIGIVSRLGGVKRALAVGLGAGGTAGALGHYPSFIAMNQKCFVSLSHGTLLCTIPRTQAHISGQKRMFDNFRTLIDADENCAHDTRIGENPANEVSEQHVSEASTLHGSTDFVMTMNSPFPVMIYPQLSYSCNEKS